MRTCFLIAWLIEHGQRLLLQWSLVFRMIPYFGFDAFRVFILIYPDTDLLSLTHVNPFRCRGPIHFARGHLIGHWFQLKLASGGFRLNCSQLYRLTCHFIISASKCSHCYCKDCCNGEKQRDYNVQYCWTSAIIFWLETVKKETSSIKLDNTVVTPRLTFLPVNVTFQFHLLKSRLKLRKVITLLMWAQIYIIPLLLGQNHIIRLFTFFFEVELWINPAEIENVFRA